MRMSVGGMIILGSLVAIAAASTDWLGKSQVGLSRLISGTVAAPANGTPDLYADWRDPNSEASAPSIAMSEGDWLKLADELAPVIYLPEPTAPELPEAPAEQQKL